MFAKNTRPEKTIRNKIERKTPDPRMGLTIEEVQERVENGWTNNKIDVEEHTIKQIVRRNVFTYFNLIFLVLAVLLCFVGSFRNLTFLPVIIFNTLIGIIQEVRAKRKIEQLNLLHIPKTKVIRDGNEFALDTEKLVLDDVVRFYLGDQISADAIVLEGRVYVNESMMTGEADEIEKGPGEELLSGSYVVSGSCYARLTRVGEDAYISKLTLEAKKMKNVEQSEMIRSLDKLVKMAGIVLIPIGILLFVQGYFINKESIKESVVSMVAALIGMIPEGLYLLASVALLVSAMRLAKRKVLLHDMKSIETLARVDILCLDKTGTITETQMSVDSVIPINMEDPENKISDFIKEMPDENETVKALKKAFVQTSERTARTVIPFSSKRKVSQVYYEDREVVLGAPELVMKERYKEYELELEEYAKKGYRILAFAEYIYDLDESRQALILLKNKVRDQAAETFSYFEKQKVKIMVLSGDHPLTVSAAAKEAGITNAERWVDARSLEETDLEEAAKKYTVFGRVTPEQKRSLIQILKKNGHTVAMTGDGVNDILALKDADCSIAMAAGSEAAIQTAQVVLLESDFSKMPEVVLEGRRVVNNMQRSASLFLVKNIFSLLLALASIICMITYPLEPAQVSMVAMFTIGIPGFFFALQKNHAPIEGHFMSNVLKKALPVGITDVILTAIFVLVGQKIHLPDEQIETAVTLLIASVGFLLLYRVSKPIEVQRGCILFLCMSGMSLIGYFVPQLFALTPLGKKGILTLFVFMIFTEPILRLVSRQTEKLKWDRMKGW